MLIAEFTKKCENSMTESLESKNNKKSAAYYFPIKIFCPRLMEFTDFETLNLRENVLAFQLSTKKLNNS